MTTQNATQDNFTILLRGFDEIIKGYPPIDKVKESLNELVDSATLDNELTFWQKEAVIARCKNYLKVEYGSQVQKEDLSDYNKSRQ